jgi:hypothetical protein
LKQLVSGALWACSNSIVIQTFKQKLTTPKIDQLSTFVGGSVKFGRRANFFREIEDFFLKLSCRPVGTKDNENILSNSTTYLAIFRGKSGFHTCPMHKTLHSEILVLAFRAARMNILESLLAG